MDRNDVVDRVCELRSRGVTPKVIARAVGLPPSQVTPIPRALAAADEVDVARRPVIECWVSPGWSNGLGVDSRSGWAAAPDADAHVGGLVSVVVIRQEYARGLGFEPHRDFAAAAAYLGAWAGPPAITFGRDGEPLYVQGPHDDPQAVLGTLDGTVGKGDYHLLVTADAPRTWVRP